MDKATKKKLKDARKLWKKARKTAEVPFGSNVEDGRYKARLTGASLGTSQSSGRFQAAWTWKILTGSYKNEETMDFDGLETEDNLVWLGRKLVRLGVELPDDLDELAEILEDLVSSGVVAMITLATKGDFQNLRIQRLVESGDDENDEDEDEEDEDDDEEEEEDEDDDEEDDDEEDEEDEDEEDEDEEEEEDEEDDEEDEDEVELEKGMRVIAKVGRKEMVGTVTSISRNGETVKVRMDKDNKVQSVSIEKIEVPEDPPPAPSGKVTKKTGRQKKSKKKSRR